MHSLFGIDELKFYGYIYIHLENLNSHTCDLQEFIHA